MTAPQPNAIALPPGHLCLTSHGLVTLETLQSLMQLQARLWQVGLGPAIKFDFQPGALVDKARDDAVYAMLHNPQAAYLLFIDGDMSFAPDIVEKLLTTAFHTLPWADIVGAWCSLRGAPYLPTIDTGTGTWEPTLPNQGPLEVIRTGSACILVKRHVYERMEAPWYKVRPAPRALDTLAEFDNFCRIKFDGRNPFRHLREWEQISGCATDEARNQRLANPTGAHGSFMSSVGEDSNFCDKSRALGFRIAVQTDAVCGHVDRRVIGPKEHKDAMVEQERQELLACGVTD